MGEKTKRHAELYVGDTPYPISDEPATLSGELKASVLGSDMPAVRRALENIFVAVTERFASVRTVTAEVYLPDGRFTFVYPQPGELPAPPEPAEGLRVPGSFLPPTRAHITLF